MGVAVGFAGAVVVVPVPVVAGFAVVDEGLLEVAPLFPALPDDEDAPAAGAAPLPAGAGPDDVGTVVIGVGASGTGLDKADATKLFNSASAGSFLFRSL